MMKKFFALVLIAVLLVGVTVYLKNDGKVENELTGEVVDYPFTGTEPCYYGRKTVKVNDTLDILANHANVTIYSHNEFYADEGECIVEVFGENMKKTPYIIIEDGYIQVRVDEDETEALEIDIYLDDKVSKLKNLHINAERGDAAVDTRVAENISVNLVHGDVDCLVVNDSSVKLKAESCSVDPRVPLVDLRWDYFFSDDYVLLDKVYMPDVVPECFVEIETSGEVSLDY